MNDNCSTHVAPRGNPVDVLVISDTLDDLCTVERILEKDGYEVRRVDDVHRTLAEVRDLLPGVLLLDAEMRSVDGIQICKVLKALPETAAIPVVFMMTSDALERLPEHYRDVLIWRHVEGLSFADVAERMDRTVDSVKHLWSRALEQLRHQLAEMP